jgi:hypothetical protein
MMSAIDSGSEATGRGHGGEFPRCTLMTVVKDEIRAAGAHAFAQDLIVRQRGDGTGLKTTVDHALIRGLDTASPQSVLGHPCLA